MAIIKQISFSSGEIAPSLYARTDLARYATALRRCRNFNIQKHGGAANRPGLQHINEIKDSTIRSRLFPFIFSDAQTYVLEFGDAYIRFYQNRGRLIVSGVAAWADTTVYKKGALVVDTGINYYAKEGHTAVAATNRPGSGSAWATVWYALSGTVFEIPSPYHEVDLPDLQIAQTADTITIVHHLYPVHELKRFDHTNWTLTPMVMGPKLPAPTGLGLAGGAAGQRYWAVTAVDAATFEESLPGLINSAINAPPGTTITWTPVVGAVENKIYRSTDGSLYGLVGKSGGTGVTATDTAWTDNSEVAGTSIPDSWAPAVGQCRNPLVLSPTKSVDGTYRVFGRVTLSVAGGTTSFALGQVRAYYKRNTDATRVAVGILTPSFLSLFVSGTNGPVAFSAGITVPDDGYTTLEIDLVPEAYLADILTGVPNVSFTCDLTTAPNNRIDWVSAVASFVDTNATPDFEQIPPSHPNVFDGPGKYPAAVGYFQQRRVFGGSDLEPEKVYLSRIGSYSNFGINTPIEDSDAVSFTLVGKLVSWVKHFVDLGRLFIFTSNIEHAAKGDQDGAILPTAINLRAQSYNGSSGVKAIVVGSTVLYVQSRASMVRDFHYNQGEETGQGRDRSTYSSHLFKGYTIQEWDYQQNPDSIIYAVRSDGKLLGFTYIREEEVYAWCWHDTDGLFESVCCVPEGGEDATYVIVNRTIDGTTMRCVEAFKTRFFTDQDSMFFVDAGLSYNGYNTDTALAMGLFGGVTWESSETLTLAADGFFPFVVGDVGKTFILRGPNNEIIRFLVDGYMAPEEVEGHADKTVPVSMRSVHHPKWARATNTFSGLSHLEGKKVSVLGDGFVLASALRPEITAITVAAGAVTLPIPVAVAHIGLPYISDLETLDIDTAAGVSTRDKKRLITTVGVMLEQSRGMFATGRAVPPDSNPLLNMDELKEREPPQDQTLPPPLLTEYRDVGVSSDWNTNGRVLIRQVDPLPLTVLAVLPSGFLPLQTG